VICPGVPPCVPGQITVTVYADQPGSDYNFTDTGAKFTIPGFSDSPALFEGFYAEAQTPIDGGYSGVSKVVSEGERTRVQNEVSDQLRSRLFEKARADLAEGFMLFDEAASISYETSLDGRSDLESNTASVNVTGTLKGVIFEKAALARRIAENSDVEYDGGNVEVMDWTTLSFAFSSASENEEEEDSGSNDGPSAAENIFSDFQNLRDVPFTLSGEARLLWEVPAQDIARTLSGSQKEEFDVLMNDYRYQVSRADTQMRPFWNDTFPTAPKDIEIEVGEVEIEGEDK
jgi:hypothetical protein